MNFSMFEIAILTSIIFAIGLVGYRALVYLLSKKGTDAGHTEK